MVTKNPTGQNFSFLRDNGTQTFHSNKESVATCRYEVLLITLKGSLVGGIRENDTCINFGNLSFVW